MLTSTCCRATWTDHPLNVPIYVTKGKGQYEGHGGGWTDLVSTLYGYIPDSVKKAVKSEVKQVAKTGFGKAANHAASFAKKHGVSDTMVDMARSEAGKRVDSKATSRSVTISSFCVLCALSSAGVGLHLTHPTSAVTV